MFYTINIPNRLRAITATSPVVRFLSVRAPFVLGWGVFVGVLPVGEVDEGWEAGVEPGLAVAVGVVPELDGDDTKADVAEDDELPDATEPSITGIGEAVSVSILVDVVPFIAITAVQLAMLLFPMVQSTDKSTAAPGEIVPLACSEAWFAFSTSVSIVISVLLYG